MHDFCFTIPYGFVIVLGGLIGFLRKGSSTSLMGGGAAGALLLLAGYMSLQAFKKHENSYFALLLETGVSVALTWVMGQRYLASGKIMPAGMVAIISGLMAAFYLYKLLTGGNHITKRQE
ncbi:hypothetical protein KP509_05G084300 [Ceratopteris richardii]|uniref:Uncharacterized protein n=1 Tax=Ceratopteris richardii TaxID=49495 RepID=A0A8T2USU9_CERRI|nr:hypothetical protein KP509_05G084300 [Ceratopteris richardii]